MALSSPFDGIADLLEGGIPIQQERAAWLRYSDVFEPSVSPSMLQLGNRISTGFYGAYLRCCSRVTDIADFLPNEEFQTASSGTYLVGGVVKTVSNDRSQRHNHQSSMSSHSKSYQTNHFGAASSRRLSVSSMQHGGGEQPVIGDKHFFPDREKRLTVMSAVAERYIHDIVQFISAMLDDEGAVSAADGNTFESSSGFGEEDGKFDSSNRLSTAKRNTRRRRHAAVNGIATNSSSKIDTSARAKRKRLTPVPVDVIPGVGCAFVQGGFFYFLWGTQAGEKLGRSELRMTRKILELQHTTVHVPLTYHLSLKGRAITVLGLCPLSVGNISSATNNTAASSTYAAPSVGILGTKSTSVREATNPEVQAFAQEVISALYMTGYQQNIQVVSGSKSSKKGVGSSSTPQTVTRGAGRECYLPPDVQMHVGGDGRLYCVANAHWMPPWPTPRANRQWPAQRFQNLRVELLVNSCISRVCCRSMHEDALITDNSHFIENTRHAVDNLLQEVVCVLGTPQETKGPDTILWRFREMGFNWSMLGLLLQVLLRNISPPMDAVKVVIREMFIRGIKSYVTSKVVDPDREQQNEKTTGEEQNEQSPDLHRIDLDGLQSKSVSTLKNGKKKAKRGDSTAGEADHLFALNMMGTEAETRSVDAHLLVRMLTVQKHNAASSPSPMAATRKTSSLLNRKKSSLINRKYGIDNPFGTEDVEASLNRAAQISLKDQRSITKSKRARRREERTEEEQNVLKKNEIHLPADGGSCRRKAAVGGSSILRNGGVSNKNQKHRKKELETERLLEEESENRMKHLLAFGEQRPSMRNNPPKRFISGRRKSSFGPPPAEGGAEGGASSRHSSYVRVPSNLPLALPSNQPDKKRGSSSSSASGTAPLPMLFPALASKGSLLDHTARPVTATINSPEEGDPASVKPLKRGRKSKKNLVKSAFKLSENDNEEGEPSTSGNVVVKKKMKLIRVKRKIKGGAEKDGDPLDTAAKEERKSGAKQRKHVATKRAPTAAARIRTVSPPGGFATSNDSSPTSKPTTPRRAINVSFSREKFSSLSSSTFSDVDEDGNLSDKGHHHHYSSSDDERFMNRNNAESEYVSSKPNFLAHLREVLLAFLNFQGSRMPRPATFTKAAIPPPGDLFGGEVIPFIYKKFRLNADTDAANLYEYMDKETKQEIYDRVCEKLGVEINDEGDVSLVVPVLQHHCVPKSVRPKWIRSRTFTLSNVVFGKPKDSINWSQIGPGLIPLYALLERTLRYHERLIRHAQSGALQDTKKSKKRSFRRSRDNTTTNLSNPSGSHSDVKRSRSQVTMEKLRKGSVWVAGGGGDEHHLSSYSDTSGSVPNTPRSTRESLARLESESQLILPRQHSALKTTEVPDLVRASTDLHDEATTNNGAHLSLIQRPSYSPPPAAGDVSTHPHVSFQTVEPDESQESIHRHHSHSSLGNNAPHGGGSSSKPPGVVTLVIPNASVLEEEGDDEDADDDNQSVVSFRARVLERASRNTNDFFAKKSRNSTAVSAAMVASQPGVGGESLQNVSDDPDAKKPEMAPHQHLQLLKSETIGNASQLLDAVCVGMFPLGLPHLVWHALQLSGSIEALIQVVEIRRDAITDGSSSYESGEWLIYIQLLRRLAVVEFLSGNITMALTYQGEALEHAESLLSILGNCFSAQMRLYTSELVSYQQHFTMDALVQNHHYKLHAGFISQRDMSTLRAEAMEDPDFILESHQLLSQQQLLLQTVMIRSISRYCEQDTQIARDYLQLGVALFESGYFKAALEHLGRSHRLFGQILGSTHQLTLISQSNICVVKYASHCRQLQQLVRTIHGVANTNGEGHGALSTSNNQEQQQLISTHPKQGVKDEDLMREKLAMEAALKMLGTIAYHRNANIDLVDCFNDLQRQYVRLKRWINNEVRAVKSISGRSFQGRTSGVSPPTSPNQGKSQIIPTTPAKIPEEGKEGPNVSNSLINVMDTQLHNQNSGNGKQLTSDEGLKNRSVSVLSDNNGSSSEGGIFGGGRFGSCASEGDPITTNNPLTSGDHFAASNNSASSQQRKSILVDRTQNNSVSMMAQRSLGVSSSALHHSGGEGVPVPQSLLKGWWDFTAANTKSGSSISLHWRAALATRMRPLAKLLRRLCPGSLEARTRGIYEEVDQSLLPYLYLRPQPPFREEDE